MILSYALFISCWRCGSEYVLILANGDIVRFPVDGQDDPFDVLDSFDCGMDVLFSKAVV